MYTVVLIRGARKDTRSWEHESLAGARRRAYALADLHTLSIVEEGNTLTIDASDYYNYQSPQLLGLIR